MHLTPFTVIKELRTNTILAYFLTAVLHDSLLLARPSQIDLSALQSLQIL